MFAAHASARSSLTRYFTVAALVGALTLVGCAPAAISTPNTSHAANTPTVVPTATTAPRTLYQADWTQRASEWTLPPHWSIANGKLVNDGHAFNAITVPYLITAPTYTVTAEIHVSSINGSGVTNQYNFVARSPDGTMLYTAGVSTLTQQNHGFSQLFPGQPDPNNNNGMATYDFSPGLSVRSYVTHVDGSYADFSIDGSSIGGVTSAVPLAPAHITLLDQNVQFEVESLTITAP